MRKILNLAAFFLFVFTFYSCASISNKVSEDIATEYYNIGKAYEDLKNWSKAADYYEKASSSKNLKESATYKMGRCYAMNKDYEKALPVYVSLLEKDPENGSLKESLAFLKGMAGDLSGAEEVYAELVKDFPDSAPYLKGYISVLLALEKNKEAYENFIVYSEKFPDEKSISDFKAKLSSFIEESEENIAEEKSLTESEETAEEEKESAAASEE